MQLSEEQQDIIKSSKNTIVISNPGTGKTTTLSMKVINLLENGVSPDKILCITFTEKAKKEMFERIFELSKGKFSNFEILKLNIHTFHSFAFSYLVDNGIVSKNIISNNILRFSLLKSFERTKAFNYEKSYIVSDMVPKTENAIRYLKSFGITYDKINATKTKEDIENIYSDLKTSYSLEELKIFIEYLIEAYKDYEKSKQSSIDYSDMLLIFIGKFSDSKFDYVLVDEMQDMNELEADIVQMVGSKIFLFGDAKQAIFGFQGGSVKNFKKFMEICDSKYLTQNRRSSQEILDYSKEHFLGRTKDKDYFRKELELFTGLKNGEIPKIVATEARLNNILKIIESNPGKSIGIITRTNKNLIEISKYLESNSIEYLSTSSQSTTKDARNEIVDFLKGLMLEDIEYKIKSLFTIFSPYTLKEAFEISKLHKKRINISDKLNKLKEIRCISRIDIDKIFDSIILPVCISKGSEWFSTGVLLKSQINEYFSSYTADLEELFDFLLVTEESYSQKGKQTNIMLTTVHKAKGLGFDIVVYIPQSSSPRTSFIDIVVECILRTNGIEIKEELEEESLRIDFVAFTRAKEKLFILADDKNKATYHIENFSSISIDESEELEIATKLNSRLSEAYSFFVSGRFEDAERLLKTEDRWLVNFIENYFSSLNSFSYSSINIDPFEFMARNIIAMPHIYDSTKFGSNVHEYMEKIVKNELKLDDIEDENVKKAVSNGIHALDDITQRYPGLKLISAEKSIHTTISSLIGVGSTYLFRGVVDAVFQHNKGHLIIDYKTDKNTNYSSEHKRQLCVYRKILSKMDGIPEDKIDLCIVYLSLRGSINTGKFDWCVEDVKKDSFKTFEKHLRTILEWKDDPKKFIQALLEKDADDILYRAIVEQIRSETSG